MPEMDGIEAAEMIRKTGAKQPPIYALTASTVAEDHQRCKQAGMNG